MQIGVGDGSQLWPIEGEPFLFLDDAGYYWFLHPLFEELREQTGEYIDLYGDAWFSNDGLSAFTQMLEKARSLINQQPDTWQVHIGTQIKPERKELFATVTKKEFSELLSALEKIAARAQALNRPVVCFGD